MNKIALAFSGGLDTTFCARWLRESTGAGIVTVTVDTGGFSPSELARIEAHARSLDVSAHHAVDARQEVYDRFVAYLILGDGLRGGVYPVSVGAERTAQAEALVRIARAVGASGVAHGSTRAGNDQVRFDVAIRALAPELKIYAPIRDLNWSRAQEAAWLAERGVGIDAQTVTYSVNSGLFGTTIGGGTLHDPWAAPPAEIWQTTVDPEQTTAAPEDLVLGFAEGLPVALDGRALGGLEIIARLNERARPHGIGRGIHLGDTILGVKGRLAFEAPAPLLLIQAHRELSKAIWTRRQSSWAQVLGTLYADHLHEGLYFDPLMRDLEAFLKSLNRRMTGDVRLRLARGRAVVTGVRSEFTLVDSSLAVYGEEARGWSGEEAAGFARLYGLSSALGAQAALRPRASSPEAP